MDIRTCWRIALTAMAPEYRHACPPSHVRATKERDEACPLMSTQRTAAGGKMLFVALYHMRSAPAAAPWAATGDTLLMPLNSDKTAADRLEQPMVPETKPLGLGGVAGEKKMMPLAIMGGTKSLTPENLASSAPITANVPAKPTPAITVSTNLSIGGRDRKRFDGC